VASPLITAPQLHSRLAADRLTLLDVRWELGGPPGIDDYRQGHIPGAVYVDLDTELSAAPGPGGRHPLPDAESFAAHMRAAGVSLQRPVVVYDAATSMSAARAWWALRYFGHPDVAVLDGGLAAWAAAGYELQSGRATPPPGDFVAAAGGMARIDAAEAVQLATSGVLIDARAAERFRGEAETVDPVAGHIPGARNQPSADNVDERGRFLEPERLRERFQALGIGDGVAVGAYCGSGVSAAHEVLALELAGYRAALYPGSWSEWITDPGRPVATGR
jgi:thiosulfate/3-mercaptopyruvate sulfurtransferase